MANVLRNTTEKDREWWLTEHNGYISLNCSNSNGGEASVLIIHSDTTITLHEGLDEDNDMSSPLKVDTNGRLLINEFV